MKCSATIRVVTIKSLAEVRLKALALHSKLFSFRVLISPGHARSVVGDAETAARIEQDHAAVAVETALQVLHGFLDNSVRRATSTDTVGRPLGKNQLHDRLAPAGAGSRGAEIIGITAAADQ